MKNGESFLLGMYIGIVLFVVLIELNVTIYTHESKCPVQTEATEGGVDR